MGAKVCQFDWSHEVVPIDGVTVTVVESVSLVVGWFGNDLRAGSCKVKSGVEVDFKATTPVNWSVNEASRASAHLVSRDYQDRPVYGGTPSDFAVVQAIREMKARRLRVRPGSLRT